MSFCTEVSVFFLKYAEELSVAWKYINVVGMFFETHVQFLENSCAPANGADRKIRLVVDTFTTAGLDVE